MPQLQWHRRAEIIPCELDAVSTAERTCSWSLIHAVLPLDMSATRKHFTDRQSVTQTGIMKIEINHTSVEVTAGATVADALTAQGMDADGIAVAVDNKVVPRAKWCETVLQENARLTVIRAVCGG